MMPRSDFLWGLLLLAKELMALQLLVTSAAEGIRDGESVGIFVGACVVGLCLSILLELTSWAAREEEVGRNSSYYIYQYCNCN
jgi:hypothetical protein